MDNCILIYDDEVSILEVMKIILEEEGFKVITSPNGETVFEDIEKYHPNLILLDIWMKGINGNEITEKLKADPKTKNIPVVLISALNETEVIANKVGADGYLKKPFDMDALVKMVNEKIASDKSA
ncbi:MAG: response regulator [Patescibacteria group bacterium]